MTTIKSLEGQEVLRQLARCFPQLYLVPGSPGAEEKYYNAVYRGMEIPANDLSHFRMSEEDRYETVETPVGTVPVVTLHERRDFEVFLWIMVNKGVPYDVPASQGSAILDGVISWQKTGNKEKEWRKNVLIVLSDGPYSNVPASAFGLDDREWRRRSGIIRKMHECTHFICRKRFPGRNDAVWDEIVADAAGLIAAFGKYDPEMAAAFLGVSSDGYTGGRLEIYVQPQEDMDSAARKVWNILMGIQTWYDTVPETDVFHIVLMLEEKQDELSAYL